MGAKRGLLIAMGCGSLLLAGLAMSMAGPEVARAGTGIIYVDRDAPGPIHDGLSWTTAYTLLQSALDAAVYGDEIWVAEGVYIPTAGITRTATFSLSNGVALYGGFGGYGVSETLRSQRDWNAHITVLTGDLDGNDLTDSDGIVTDTANITGSNAYHVVYAAGVTSTTVLDGFSVTAGWAAGDWPTYDGGGVYIWADSSPTLSNLEIIGNFAEHGGGGMTCGGDPTLTAVVFRRNHSDLQGGGLYTGGGNPVLSHVSFVDNYAESQGGGMYDWAGSPILYDTTFFRNRTAGAGGGLDTFAGIDARLINVRFIGNSAGAGGGMNSRGDATLTNVVFVGNSASWGGALDHGESHDMVLTNSTFCGNQAAVQGGGLYTWGSGSVRLTNVILAGNTAATGSQIYNSTKLPLVAYSLVEGSGGSGGGWDPTVGVDGGGNIDADPLFVDPDGSDNITGTLDDDLRLAFPSPAIDAGDNAALPTGITIDLEGIPRFLDIGGVTDTGSGTPPIVDMGAYETVPVSDLEIAKEVTPAVVGPGWPITYIISFANIGTESISETIVITDSVPSEVVSSGVISSGVVITEVQGGPDFVWKVGPLEPGEGGVITVSGYITLSVSGLFSLTNQATITSAVDEQMHNNVSVVTNTVDAEPPQIESVSPVSGTKGVRLDAAVVVAFSEEIDAGTLTYTVEPDPGGWAENWSDEGTTVTLTHTLFENETVYTVTVTGASDVVGNPLMGGAQSWSFTTGQYLVYFPLIMLDSAPFERNPEKPGKADLAHPTRASHRLEVLKRSRW